MLYYLLINRSETSLVETVPAPTIIRSINDLRDWDRHRLRIQGPRPLKLQESSVITGYPVITAIEPIADLSEKFLRLYQLPEGFAGRYVPDAIRHYCNDSFDVLLSALKHDYYQSLSANINRRFSWLYGATHSILAYASVNAVVLRSMRSSEKITSFEQLFDEYTFDTLGKFVPVLEDEEVIEFGINMYSAQV